MADRQFVFDGSPKWEVERALDTAAARGGEEAIPAQLAALEDGQRVATPRWLADRLTVLWTMFMASRAADARALAVWMAETGSLLSDIPHDILATSIDQAIKGARHGFMPSVGEIRAVADPAIAERNQQIERLRRMSIALQDPAAGEARAARRDEQARRERFARAQDAAARH